MLWRIAAGLAAAALIYGAFAANDDWERHRDALGQRAKTQVRQQEALLAAMRAPRVPVTVDELVTGSGAIDEERRARFLEVRGRFLEARLGKDRVACVLIGEEPAAAEKRPHRIECWFELDPSAAALKTALDRSFAKGDAVRLVGYYTGFRRGGVPQLGSTRLASEGE